MRPCFASLIAVAVSLHASAVSTTNSNGSVMTPNSELTRNQLVATDVSGLLSSESDPSVVFTNGELLVRGERVKIGPDETEVQEIANAAVETNALTVDITNRVALLESSKADKSALGAHVANTDNPHAVTAAQVGAVPLVEDSNGEKTAVTIGSRTRDEPIGPFSIANGNDVTASEYYSHAEGSETVAAGATSHAEGLLTIANGQSSHAEGRNTAAYGHYSHAEGCYSKTRTDDDYAFAWNGDDTKTVESPYASHGEGTFNINPVGGLEGFYIGEQTLYTMLINKLDRADVIDPVIATANGQAADAKAVGDRLDGKLDIERASGYWSGSETYAKFDIVMRRNSNNVYVSLADGNAGHDPTASSAWWRSYTSLMDAEKFVNGSKIDAGIAEAKSYTDDATNGVDRTKLVSPDGNSYQTSDGGFYEVKTTVYFTMSHSGNSFRFDIDKSDGRYYCPDFEGMLARLYFNDATWYFEGLNGGSWRLINAVGGTADDETIDMNLFQFSRNSEAGGFSKTKQVAYTLDFNANNEIFSNAVRAVGLNIDTNAVDRIANAAVETNALTVDITNRVALLESSKADKSALGAHVANTSNPHAVTAAQVGAVPLVEDWNGDKTAVTIGSSFGTVGMYSLMNGLEVSASGNYSHSEGHQTSAGGTASHAEGWRTTALADYSHASGTMSETKSGHDYAFVWNGDQEIDDPYVSHGIGTFNINPYGGLGGFFIGDRSLPDIFDGRYLRSDSQGGPPGYVYINTNVYFSTVRTGNLFVDSFYDIRLYDEYGEPLEDWVKYIVSTRIDANDSDFSSAVLAVGLNIDTNSVAVLNDIAATFGGFPITGTATTVGGLLAALAAAVAWLKKNKVSSFESVGGATATVGNGVAKLDDFFTESNSLLNGRLAYSRNATGLKDRAFNTLSFDGTEYNLSTALAAVTPTASGQPRDLLIVATATAATTISFTAGTIKGDKPTIDGSGTWLITLTEYAANTWYCRQIKMEDAA